MSADDKVKKPKKKKSEKNLIFRLLSFIVLPFMAITAKIKLINSEVIPKTGAVVISPNHLSNIDPLVIAVAVWKAGRAPRFLAKASLFKIPIVGAALRASGQVPVVREANRNPNSSAEAMKQAQHIIDNEAVVIVYPEGTLTREPDLWPMRGKTGAVRIAREADIPIIPVAHWGTQEVMPRYVNKLRIFPRKTIEVKFGEPYRLADLEQVKAEKGLSNPSEILAAETEDLMDRITDLLSELRGETPPETRWDPKNKAQPETGKF